jgi:DNA-binding NarL/FixJ family response regulator
MATTAEKKIKILIADDQFLFADNLKLTLETLSNEINVVGIAVNGKEAVAMAEELRPDIILMDVRMPVMDGVEAIKILHQKLPEIKILVISTFPDDSYVKDAICYGAYGYILKNTRSREVIASIQAISNGLSLFSPLALDKLIHKESDGQETDEDESDEYLEIKGRLKKREREILTLVAKGYSNQKIADTLYISEPTVRNYISAIYTKVGTSNRLQLMSLVPKKNAGKD